MNKYYVELTDPNGKVMTLDVGGNLSWSRGHCYKLIKDCKKLDHFKGFQYKVKPN